MEAPRVGPAAFLRRWWLVVLLATVAGALVSYAVGSRISPRYEASSQVLIEGEPGLVPTYAELVKSTPVLGYALRSARSGRSAADVRDDVRGEADQSTRLVTLRADAPTSGEAIALANGLSAGLRWYVSTAASSSSVGTPPAEEAQVRVVEPADSSARVRPRSLLSLEFGAAVGLFAALAFAFIAEARKPRVSEEEMLGVPRGLAVLASVNRGLLPGEQASLDLSRNGTDEAASYRQLATQIVVANGAREPRSLLVLGAENDEGSAHVATKLALTLAHDGRRVVLADVGGRDRVGRLFGLGGPGAATIVKRGTSLEFQGVTLDRHELRSGVPLALVRPRSALPALSLETAEDFVGRLSTGVDLVILHGPPPGRSRGSLTWARTAGATVLVVRAQHTSRTQVDIALAGLEPARANLLGAVLETGRA